MSEDMIQQISEAIRRRAARPIEEQFQDMIDRGAINERGEVLLKGSVGMDMEDNEVAHANARQPTP